MPQKVVIRLIAIVGNSTWVDKVLDKSYFKEDQVRIFANDQWMVGALSPTSPIGAKLLQAFQNNAQALDLMDFVELDPKHAS